MIRGISIYVSHPYGGQDSNYEEITDIVRELTRCSDFTFISPIHAFGFMYDDISYEKGMNLCLSVLDFCNEMWVFGDYLNSKGCKTEIAYCDSRSIPYRIFNSIEEAVEYIIDLEDKT